MPIIFAVLSNEALNAIIVAIFGSAGAFIISRYTAKRQADRDDTDDARAFRGELREDNKSLREENRDLRRDNEDLRDRVKQLEAALNQVQTNAAKSTASIEKVLDNTK